MSKPRALPQPKAFSWPRRRSGWWSRLGASCRGPADLLGELGVPRAWPCLLTPTPRGGC